MKIYPSPHLVRVAEVPEYLDIPVTHIEQEYHPEKIIATLSPEFALEEKEFVGPYQRFPTDNLLFFDNAENIIKLNLKKNGYNYMYEPSSVKEFTPEEFKVWALVKRKDRIDPYKNYDLRVGVYNQSGSETFAEKLIAIFGDAPYRKISPPNVEVNSGSTLISDLLTTGGDGFDWLFVETHDAVKMKDGSTAIDFDTFMRNNANLWLTVENGGVGKIFTAMSSEEKYAAPLMEFDGKKFHGGGKTPVIFDKTYGYYAKSGIVVQSMPKSEYVYHSLEEKAPVVIIEKPNSGYIVVSSKKMFDRLDKYSSYVYHIMLQLYFKSYLRTAQKNTWITNSPVDYVGSLTSPFRRCHPVVNLDDMVMKVDKNTVNYELKSVMFDVKDILYIGKDNSNNMSFKKLVAGDPSIGSDDVSIYTSKRTVAIYRDQGARTIESSVLITPEIDDEDRCYITVAPFKSSKYKLVLNESKRLYIKKPTEEYVLYALPIDSSNESVVGVMPSKEYNVSAAVEIARIKVKLAGEPVAYDVRLLGGGLPKGYTDYEMLDISNIKGRPYRVGTGAIVNLPAECEEHHAKITTALEKHKVAGDKIYIRYGDIESRAKD